MAADLTYHSKIQIRQGADTLAVASGGTIDVESGGALKIAGTDKTSAVAAAVTTPVAGIAASYKLARGEATLDGTNPTPIVTGLATVVGCTASLKAAASPSDDPTSHSLDYGGSVTAGTVNLYAYKTNGSDPTLVDSTNNAAVFSWIAVGT